MPPDGSAVPVLYPGFAQVAAARSAPPRWAPDLAAGIGSWRWFRDLGVLAVLIYAALVFWPAAEASSPAPANRTVSRPPVAPGPLPVRPAQSAKRTSVLPGETLAQALQRAGADASGAKAAAGLVGTAIFPERIEPGATIEVFLRPPDAPGTAPTLEGLRLRARLDLFLTLKRQHNSFAVSATPVSVDATPIRMRGQAGGHLAESLVDAGTPPAVIKRYLAAIADQHDLTGDVTPFDSFDLIYANRRAADGLVAPGELLYAALLRGERPLAELVRWNGEEEFFAVAGQRRGGAARDWPVNGRFTSAYGMRYHPILGLTRMHAGIDIGAAWGTPVHAIASGTVAFAGWHGGHGNFVRLSHSGGLATGYAHLSRMAVGPGTQVGAGQIIGYVGSTGLSTGPHLHYEAYRDGRSIDPAAAGTGLRQAQAATHSPPVIVKGMAALKTISPAYVVTNGLATAKPIAAMAR